MATIHNIRKLGYSNLNLDLRGLTKAFTSTMLPLSARCRALLHEGCEVRLELPEDHKLARLMENSNWAHLIDPREYAPSTFAAGSHLPAIVYNNEAQQFEAVDKIVNFVLQNMDLDNRAQLGALEWAVNEIADNVLNHAESRIGGIVQVNAHRDKAIEFVVCDAGLGIPRTLRSTHPYLTSDSEALDRAIREGVTRDQERNQGNGLYGSYRLAQLSNGYFHINSGYASLAYTEKSGFRSVRQDVPYPGSSIVCAVKLNDSELLSEALTFKGKRYSPYTYVDRLEEQKTVKIDLSTECRSFGSRAVAQPLRMKIENILKTTDAQIVLELSDVALITSSFADEVFGKIFVLLGPIGFSNRIVVSGTNKIVRQLIDRSIMQRMATNNMG